MIDSFVKVQEAKYRTIIQKIIKAASLYSCMALCLGLFVVYKSNKLETSKLLLESVQSNVQFSSRKLMAANAATSKMQTFLYNARLERKQDLNSQIKTFKHTINSLASKYKIVGPVGLKISAPSNYRDTSSINLEILVKARNEESIIGFTDSLVKSLAGFLKIEKVIMAKAPLQQISSRRMNDLMSCKLKLNWYVLLKR